MSQNSISIVILDIEGTTTPISFVADVLFPYARSKLKSHLEQHWGSEELKGDIEALRKLGVDDAAAGNKDAVLIPQTTADNKNDVIEAVCQSVYNQMDIDRKTTALKQLQGHIWDAGYKSGELKGVVYDDVLCAFNTWRENKIPTYIYSSGSILGQKLLFGYSDKGDLLPYLSGHFDTTIGLKVEEQSYTRILEDISKTHPGIEANQVLFVTDNPLEAIAADKVGIRVLVAVRPGNKELPSDLKFNTIDSFDIIHKTFSYAPLK